ncbi:YciI family protein [Bacillus horti]|uniref:YCII-related domain-containing protein n=1 Tax=Caldalkalibacillus horti TaxID=77523 RepID=A0ABT9VVD7_9BACI|nr:YciI family protein [Bacillus horti]MDQ0164936.1 hypothetical protein [Bacillus horti]
MRFILLVKATGHSEARVPLSPEFRLAKAKYLASMAEKGVLISAEELLPSNSGLRMTYTSHEDAPEMECGPFSLDSSLLAEYMVIEAKSLEDAADIANQFPIPEGYEHKNIELRRLKDAPPSLTNPWLENDLENQLGMLRSYERTKHKGEDQV